MAKTSKYQVLVANVGIVYSGNVKREALAKYRTYRLLSKMNHGRMGGESVTLFVNDEIAQEYSGTQEQA